MRILLVEDDEILVKFLTAILIKQNYVVDTALDGASGWELVETFPYDLVLLDIMLPKLDGINFCRRLREKRNQVLVMMLTARDGLNDKLLGLDSGADDYVVKPFDVQELAARIRALLRRGQTTTTSPLLICGHLSLDPNMREVLYQGKTLQFSRKEYLLLELLLRNQNQVFSRSEIIDHLWSLGEEPPNEDTIKSHIKSVRRKLSVVGANDFIETLYGQGYRVNPIYLAETSQVSSQERQQKLELAVANIWQRTKDRNLERLNLLEESLAVLKAGAMKRDAGTQMMHTAHKLVGSLGAFGFDEGARLAKQIEQVLQHHLEDGEAIAPSLSPSLLAKLETLVTTLHQHLQDLTSSASTLPALSLDDPPSRATPLSLPAIPYPVLLLDENPHILDKFQIVVESGGLCLTQVETEAQFWERLFSLNPALLLLQLDCSGWDGLALCRSIRHHAQWNRLPVLLLTSHTDRETVQQIFASGADDYVTMPIVPEELSVRIFNCLQRRQGLGDRPTR